MNIYILVEVAYDYYRFQENKAAVSACAMDEAFMGAGFIISLKIKGDRV